MCEDVPYGKMSRPWPMPGPQRARPAGPEHAYFGSSAELPFQNLAIFYLKIAHWSILLTGNEGNGTGLPAGIARSGATDPILFTQRIPRGRDSDFIY